MLLSLIVKNFLHILDKFALLVSYRTGYYAYDFDKFLPPRVTSDFKQHHYVRIERFSLSHFLCFRHRHLPTLLAHLITAPCAHTFCAFGANCVVDKKAGEGKCQCIETCTNVFAPVCGTDRVTYSSECHLVVASCSQQKRITVRFRGACGKFFVVFLITVVFIVLCCCYCRKVQYMGWNGYSWIHLLRPMTVFAINYSDYMWLRNPKSGALVLRSPYA